MNKLIKLAAFLNFMPGFARFMSVPVLLPVKIAFLVLARFRVLSLIPNPDPNPGKNFRYSGIRLAKSRKKLPKPNK